ncbi:MAG: glycoside hydrolase family 31 protein [Bacteroidota bacterium]|nr:DUF4968 domain-containing protein [Candidatus Kapabacteria bacterium]MDW8219495.1 glycoside hydrolase family 31 protein [Bacteroidota bacterium]
MNAQLQRSLGRLERWNIDEQGMLCITTDAHVRITAYSATIIRVRVALCTGGQPQWDNHSFAVVAAPQPGIQLDVAEQNDALVLRTKALTVLVQKNPVRMKFFSAQGHLLNEDEPAFGTAWIGDEITTYKRLLPGERFIGLGEKGGLDKRGRGFTNWNTDAFGYGAGTDPLYGTTPFYIGLHSTSGNNLVYGIFLDNSYKSHFNFGASNQRFSAFTVEGGEMNYYFIHRPTVGEIVQDYTLLTGRMELPPLWALGYHQCRYSYFPDTEVLSVARTFREKNIPADVLWLDIHYMDNYKVFTWHPERFPHPTNLLGALDAMGFRTVAITDPGIKIEAGYEAYDDGVKNDVFVKYPDGTYHTSEVWPGWCHFPDFTKESVRRWWGDKLKPLIQDGIDGFWTDMNEPATWGNRFPDMVEFDCDGHRATHKKAHNVYGMQMARATYEGARRHYGSMYPGGGKRPFTLTRAFYSGVQRYAAVWTGDNTASDEHILLGAQLVANLGLTGIPFAGVDIGGFNGNGSRELFARWMSVGAFTPFFRTHAAIYTKEQEPWSFGEDVEEICKQYIELRYKLLPYLYSTVYEATQTGLPIARSLALFYPFDDMIYDRVAEAQYMFGAALMVAPVPSTKDLAKVYLPEGEWYDMHNDRKYTGKQTIIVETPLERLPLFVKAGHMLVMQSVIQSTKQKPNDTLYIHLYAGKTGSTFVYYEDDGETYLYQQGDYYKRAFIYNPQMQTFRCTKADGKRLSHFRNVRLIFHGFGTMPSHITAAGRKVALERYSTPLLKPSSGYDPLGVQHRTASEAPTYSAAIEFPAEEILVKW